MARAIDCKTCLHEKVCALWWDHERQDASCFCKDGCDYFTPALSPPNEPLTLDELRQMDGDPVWIVDVGPHKWYGPGWAIVDRDNCLMRTAKNWNPVFFERYGERWLAYRRPPEGETDA